MDPAQGAGAGSARTFRISPGAPLDLGGEMRHIGAAISSVLLKSLPIDVPYPVFALILLLNGLSIRCFASPNRGRQRALADGSRLLPGADLGAVPFRLARRVLHRCLRDRGDRVV